MTWNSPIRSTGRTLLAAVASIAVLALTVGLAGADVDNGSFETGDFTGWTVDDTGNGSWYVYSGTVTPIQQRDVPAPACGTYAAVSDQGDPSAMVVYQDIALAAGETHTLSFQHYYLNDPPSLAGEFVTPPDLDINNPNQQYRVDIMDPAADPYSLAASDVYDAVFRTDVGDPQSSGGWQPVEVDLSAWAGQTVRLRYAVAATEDGLNAGVDCVEVTSAPIPTTTVSAEPPAVVAAPAAQAVAARPAFTG